MGHVQSRRRVRAGRRRLGTLSCTDCRSRNYTTTVKRGKPMPNRKKHCPRCNKHTIHICSLGR